MYACLFFSRRVPTRIKAHNALQANKKIRCTLRYVNNTLYRHNKVICVFITPKNNETQTKNSKAKTNKTSFFDLR